MLKFRLLMLTLLLTLMASSASACGGLFCQNVPVSQQGERIIFTMNGDGTISAYVQINYTGSAPDFSWVVPVPTVPDIDVAEMDLFDELDLLTQPVIMPPQFPDNCELNIPQPVSVMSEMGMVADSAEFEVQVLASGTAGPFAYDVVDSPDPNALIEWLRDNDYQVTQDMEPLIHIYNDEGMPFLAMKLQPDQGVQDIQPVVMTYESELPMIPIRLTAVAANPNMNILTWIFADEQAYPQNYEHITIRDRDIRGEQFTFTGNNYMQLLDDAIDEENGLAMTTEYAQPTSELAELQITDPTLQQLTQDYTYVTRLLGRMSPEEMTLDPIFAFDGSRDDVSNIRDLTDRNAHVFWQCDPIFYPSNQALIFAGIVGAFVLTFLAGYWFNQRGRGKQKNS
ncbi:MAG: DUF2330 domain-containing protein [Chloroflexota bacterium]